MPYSVGDSELRIVASQDLGPLGPRDGQPVVFHWRWYYHVPTLPLWGLIFLLLVVPKANRHRQAWLILIPLGLMLLLPRMLATLLAAPDDTAEWLTYSVGSFAMAWSAIWLIAHRLATRSRTLTLLLIVAAMSAIGVSADFCRSGTVANWSSFAIGFGLFGGVVSLAMMLSARSCRRRYSAGRFRLWLFLWTVVSATGLMACFSIIMMLVVLRDQISHVAPTLLFLIPASAVYGVVLYLGNLPFLELIFRTAFYRERFEKLVRIEKTPEATAGCPFAQEPVPVVPVGQAPRA